MKLAVAIVLLCVVSMAAAYTVLSGCGCHFGGCICADDGPGARFNGKNFGLSFGLKEHSSFCLRVYLLYMGVLTLDEVKTHSRVYGRLIHEY